jgi:hypothetical protein
MTSLNRDYGSTEPFADPYTPAQHADIARGLAAAKMADALKNAAEHWQAACGASLGGDERSAEGFRVDAHIAMDGFPLIRSLVLASAAPIHKRKDAHALLEQARDLIERVRNSTLPGTAREQHLAVAMGAIDNDIDALERGE